MKKKYILFSAALFALLGLKSCLIDSKSLSEPFGIVQVEIAESMDAVTRADDNTMESIRFIVFTDLDTTPKAEINIRHTSFTVEPAVGTTPPRVRFSLKVGRKPTGSNEKLIVAIINEPSSMTAGLDEKELDITIAELEAMKLDMAQFVNNDHLSLKSNVAIPMTGAIWTDKLFRTATEAMTAGNALTMEVQRAVARVDVYLKKGQDVDPDMKYTTGSTVKLENTYDQSNYMMHTYGSHTLGTVQTVASGFLTKTWSYTSTPQAITEGTPVCVFYTPERKHTANRLKLSVSVKTPEGATRSGVLEITEAYNPQDPEKELHDVDVIQRNHIYNVIATIGTNGITGEVADWNDENLTTEF